MAKYIKIDGKRVTLSKGMGAVTTGDKTMLQVNYYSDNKRKRKFFEMTSKGLEEAKRFLADRENERKAHGENFGSISPEERHAIELFRAYTKEAQRNGMPPRNIADIVSDALKSMKTQTPTVREIAKSLLEKLIKENKSSQYISGMTNYMERAAVYFDEKQIHQIEATDITNYIESARKLNGNLISQQYKRHLYNSIFTLLFYAADKGHISLEQVQILKRKTDRPAVERTEISALTIDETKNIFATIKADKSLHKYIPFMVMGCFCGLRSAERARIKFSDIYAGNKKEIFVSAKIAKTNEQRYINIQENAHEWLEFAKAQGVDMAANSYIIEGESENERISESGNILKKIFKKAGITYKKNIIRHSAATYLTEYLGIGLAVNQLGHSEAICRKNYKRPVSRDDAKAYFNIFPATV